MKLIWTRPSSRFNKTRQKQLKSKQKNSQIKNEPFLFYVKTKDIHIKVTRARKEIQTVAHSPIIPAQGLKNQKTTDPRDMKAAEGRGATMWGCGVGWH